MDIVDPSPAHCLKDDCRAKTRKQDSDMIRCIICCVLHHAECVSVPKDQTKQIWTCFTCRQITQTVNELKKELSDMHENQKNMLKLLNDMISKLTKENELRTTAERELQQVKEKLTEVNEKWQMRKH